MVTPHASHCVNPLHAMIPCRVSAMHNIRTVAELRGDHRLKSRDPPSSEVCKSLQESRDTSATPRRGRRCLSTSPASCSSSSSSRWTTATAWASSTATSRCVPAHWPRGGSGAVLGQPGDRSGWSRAAAALVRSILTLLIVTLRYFSDAQANITAGIMVQLMFDSQSLRLAAGQHAPAQRGAERDAEALRFRLLQGRRAGHRGVRLQDGLRNARVYGA